MIGYVLGTLCALSRRALTSLSYLGSRAHLTPRSITNLMELVGFKASDHFVDFGSAFGIPNVAVYELYGLKDTQNVGLEIQPALIEHCMRYNLPITFRQADICRLTRRDINKVTVVWAFSKVFLPEVFNKLKYLVERAPHVRILITSEKLAENATNRRSKFWTPMCWASYTRSGVRWLVVLADLLCMSIDEINSNEDRCAI